MAKVGILCAGDREFAPFLPHLQGCKTSQKTMLTFHEGIVCDTPIVALFCGVCKTNAAVAAQILIDTYHVDMVINGGTAGGMDASVGILDTVISTEIAHHDMQSNILTAFHPWMSSEYFYADEPLINLARIAIKPFEHRHRIHFGRMVTGEAFISDERREGINAAFAPLSVDMETASIAQVCYVNRIPFIAIRTITDDANHSASENFEKNCQTASEISKEIILALLSELARYGK